MEVFDTSSLPDLLPIYYKRVFPFGPYFKWFNYGGRKNYFTHREFSFTLKDDIYIRYQSFNDQLELEKEIQKRCPYKIDIGAIFSHKPKDHRAIQAASFQALEKEVVFDIDMTDYDDVRFCCSGADICEKCWPLMTMAVKIIHRALSDDFGFEHILWVYSGRRGIHCWVCDESARRLSQQARSAIAEYLQLIKGGEQQIKKVTLMEQDCHVHPSILKAVQVIEDAFIKYAVRGQDFMDTDEKIKKVVQLIPDLDFQSLLLEEDFTHATNSAERWAIVKKRVSECQEKGITRKCWQSDKEIMLQYCYPRLDINVSKGINHLLKSPFCVHPKTGKICVPINPLKVDEFNPFTVPTISQVCEDLNKIERGDKENSHKVKADYKLTSLRPYIEIFDRFLKNLEKSWKGTLIQNSDATLEF